MTNSTKNLPIAVLDIETDPFLLGRIPKAFCTGFFDGVQFRHWWGPDCMERQAEFLRRTPWRFLIFAHNGGRFDFHYLFPWLDNPVTIIAGRIVKARLLKHWIQDSFALIPVPLHYGGGKLKIDYRIFEAGEREKPVNRKKIVTYLEADCVALYEFVSRFHEDFGRQLTVGATAIKQLRLAYDFARMGRAADRFYRGFYYGGRVQAIEPGDHRGPFRVYDVRSMYPYVMAHRRHPINGEFLDHDRLPPPSANKVYFARIEATSAGALPVKIPDGVDFPHGRQIFDACSHEIETAKWLGLLQIHRVIFCKVAQETTRFQKFVDHFYSIRKWCRSNKDVHGELFAKFMLNACYGKFGTSEENLFDWRIKSPPGEDKDADILQDPTQAGGPWKIYSSCPWFDLYRRPALHTEHALFDVSIAASITSAARAVLMEGLAAAKRPIYCDTDSIICKKLPVAPDLGELGDWQLEGIFDRAVIAGKKLYALAKRRSSGRYSWKKVRSKGGTLNGSDLVKIAAGGSVLYKNKVPTYSTRLDPKFIERRFRRTD